MVYLFIIDQIKMYRYNNVIIKITCTYITFYPPKKIKKCFLFCLLIDDIYYIIYLF